MMRGGAKQDHEKAEQGYSTQILDALLIQEKPNVVVLNEVKKCSMLKLLTSFVLTFFFFVCILGASKNCTCLSLFPLM